jgi:uncharacterized protein YndB with AHSA1/START domain
MVNIIHRVGIKATTQKVYEALATVQGISDWWTKDTTGESEIGKTVVTRFHTLEGKEIGSMKFEVKGLEAGKKINWKFVEGPQDWIGTEVIFDLHQEENFTIVLFSHINWAVEGESKAHCSMKWAIFMLSLKQLVETGEGKPSPNDIKIDNWN